MGSRQSKFIIITCLVISAIIVSSMLGKKSGPPKLPVATLTPAKAEVPEPVIRVSSSDGNLTLIMKRVKSGSSLIYKFLVEDDNGLQKEIFSNTVSAPDLYSVPLNTFSPDNKYVFIKETVLGQTNYIVLTSTGDPVIKDSQILNFSDLFTVKYPDYKITDVTGWAAPGLIIINTNKQDDTTGPSFWFDLYSKSFIRLSTRFN